MNPINRLKNRSLKRIAVIAAAVFALSIGSSSAFAQHGGGGGGGHGGGGGGGHGGGGGGHMGGGGGGHVGGGGGGHVGGGGGHVGGGGGGHMGGGGHPMGGGQPQGIPRSGPIGTTGRLGGRDFDGRHSETDHNRRSDGRDFDHRNPGRFDHGDHGRDFNHRGHFRDRDRDFDRRFFFYDPFFYGYPYYNYPYYNYPYYYPNYPYNDYGYYSDPTYSYPAETENGGVSLAVTPADASVYVDNNYVGIASSFSSGSQPLSLPAGSHRIELQAPGYVSTAFNVNVVQGQVTPYHVSLKPDR